MRLEKTHRFSHAYLLETNGVSYGYSLALDMAKFFLCFGQDDPDFICNLVDSGNHPDFIVIDSNRKAIKKEDMLELQKRFSVKPVYGSFLVYLIKDATFLNRSSANTILKFLEEPHDGIIAILLADHHYQVLDTISSRCQILSLNDDFNVLTHCFENYGVDGISYDEFVESDVFSCLKFFLHLEQDGMSVLLESTDLKDRLSLIFEVGYYFYYDLLQVKLKKECLFFTTYSSFCENFIPILSVDDIIKKIELFHNYMKKSSFYLNKDLCFDSFVLDFCGGDVDG